MVDQKKEVKVKRGKTKRYSINYDLIFDVKERKRKKIKFL